MTYHANVHPGRQSAAAKSEKFSARLAGLLFLILGLLVGMAPAARAEMVSVPFSRGFIGAVGTNTNQANGIRLFGTLGVQRAFFMQDSAARNAAGETIFQGTQGNDIGGTLRLVLQGGQILDIPGAINWRDTRGSTLDAFGFIPAPTATTRTISYGTGQSYSLDSSRNYGLQVNASTTTYSENANISGNAATSGLVDQLNTYLADARRSAPQGPVTVEALTTESPAPTLTGTVTLRTGESLTVVVNGRSYGSGALTVEAGRWSLAIPASEPLPLGRHDVTATILSTAGYTLSDATSGEVLIAAAPVFVDGEGEPVRSYAFRYAENRGRDDSLGRVRATIAGDATITYAILAGPVDTGGAALFAIAADGTIRLTAAGIASAANDHETLPNEAELTVRAASGGLSSDVTVALEVADLPDSGRISGRVTTWRGQPLRGTVVTLLDGSGQPAASRRTDADGTYLFENLVPGTYSVRFSNPSAEGEIRGKSDAGTGGQGEVRGIQLDDGEQVESVDGFLIDPSGVIYDSVTRAPVAGAQVRLYVTPSGGSRRPVHDDELDRIAGDSNGVTVGSSGLYSFLLKSNAPTGRYDIEVVKDGYLYPSATIAPAEGVYSPALGGEVEAIQTQQEAPTGNQDTLWYRAFDFIFAETLEDSSNGVIHNHIPLDPLRAALSVQKEAVLPETVVPGARMSWTVTATNTGNVTLAALTLEDRLMRAGVPVAGVTIEPKEVPQSLAPMGTAVWTVSHDLVQEDLDAGGLENLALVTASLSGGETLTVESAPAGNAEPGEGKGTPTVTPLAAPAALTITLSDREDAAERNGGTPTEGRFLVTLSAPAPTGIELSYNLSGTATPGVDYDAPPAQLVIPQGETSAELVILPVEDDLVEDDEEVILTLLTAPAGILIEDAAAQLVLLDDDIEGAAGLLVDLRDDTASEDGDTGTIGISLLRRPVAQVRVTFSGDGQCALAPASMTFEPDEWNQQQVLTLTPLQDGNPEGLHACLTLASLASDDPAHDGLEAVLPGIAVTDSLDDTVRDRLRAVLQEDLRETLAIQSQQFSDMAADAARRLRRNPDEETCGWERPKGPQNALSITAGVLSADLQRQAKFRDCASGRRRISESRLTLSDHGDGGRSAYLWWREQRERQPDADRLAGWFHGGYARLSRPAEAEGEILGLGLNAGHYGARRLGGTLVLDHYLALAAGHHRFDLSFGEEPIRADGAYSYGAAFAGLALSGTLEMGSLLATPRGGLDLTLGLPGPVRYDLGRGGLAADGRLELDRIANLRLFAEFGLGPALDPEPGAWEWEAVPGLFCERDFAGQTASCGHALTLRLAHLSKDRRQQTRAELDLERDEDGRSRASLSLAHRRTWDEGRGSLDLTLGTSGGGQASAGLEVRQLF